MTHTLQITDRFMEPSLLFFGEQNHIYNTYHLNAHTTRDRILSMEVECTQSGLRLLKMSAICGHKQHQREDIHSVLGF